MPHLDYFLAIDQDIIKHFKFEEEPITVRKRSHRLNERAYYNYRKARIPGVDEIREVYADEIFNIIMNLLRDQAEELMQLWHRDIPKFFYRREKGVSGNVLRSNDLLGDTVKDIMKAPTTIKGRKSSGRLREALFIYSISINGIRFGIHELYNPRDTTKQDYVKILKSGAGPNPYAPYNPYKDIREKYRAGSWGGFPNTYWKAWDAHFKQAIAIAERDLTHQIRRAISDIERQQQADIRRIRRGTSEKDLIEKRRQQFHNTRRE